MYLFVCMCIQWSVYMYVFVCVEVPVCTCTWWCVYLCVVCRCGTRMCVHTCKPPFQMTPQEGSPNNLGVFSWAPLYRNSVRQQFCSQTWVAGRWPFDVCWAPLALTWRCAWAGQGALEVSVRLFRAAAWRCLESHLCIALKIGGMGQGVVHWNTFCARRCFWQEESMTHWKGCIVSTKPSGLRLQASSCGQGCKEVWNPDRSLWNKTRLRVQALGLVRVTVHLWRGPWSQSHYPPGIYCCPNAVHILISHLFLWP